VVLDGAFQRAGPELYGVAFFCQREDYKFEVRYYPL